MSGSPNTYVYNQLVHGDPFMYSLHTNAELLLSLILLCVYMINKSLITHVSMLFTILSMSDCLGMCFIMTNNGVSTGTSG